MCCRVIKKRIIQIYLPLYRKVSLKKRELIKKTSATFYQDFHRFFTRKHYKINKKILLTIIDMICELYKNQGRT